MSGKLSFIPKDGNYRFSSTLVTPTGSATYTFDVRWNTRDDAWRFDMYDPDGILMVAGVKIVLNVPLGRRSAHSFFNNNSIIAMDSSLSGLDPNYDDLGTRVVVWHLTDADLMSLVVAT